MHARCALARLALAAAAAIAARAVEAAGWDHATRDHGRAAVADLAALAAIGPDREVSRVMRGPFRAS